MQSSTQPKARASKPRAAARKAPPDTVTASAAAPETSLPQAQTGAAIHGASLLFDQEWYRKEYPDVAGAGIDPIRHYFDDGAREGRDPNPFFSTSSYVERYSDVAASRMNPFLHYLLYGAREGRTPGR